MAERQQTRRQQAAAGAPADEQTKLEGDALQERARELGIPGRSDKTADELRAAIAELEALSGEELDERARALNVEGRSNMTADEKRAAVAQAAGGPAVPPAPPAPSGAQSPSSGGGEFPKSLLISRAPNLLGYSVALAQGVLAEAEDSITIDAAKARIQTYLDSPVVANTEEA